MQKLKQYLYQFGWGCLMQGVLCATALGSGQLIPVSTSEEIQDNTSVATTGAWLIQHPIVMILELIIAVVVGYFAIDALLHGYKNFKLEHSVKEFFVGFMLFILLLLGGGVVIFIFYHISVFVVGDL